MALFSLISLLLLLLAIGLQAAPTHHRYHHARHSFHIHDTDSLPPELPAVEPPLNKQAAREEPRIKNTPRDLQMVSVVALTAASGTARGFVDDTLVLRSPLDNNAV
ncbi:hypothetical protein B0I35DRAFT_405813 [Stachybotrys elegans]|uniref:Uncharacterized protein n=1 Tax=Stachybotrys elegans TaxID=80388 RepID=A0A8K0T3U5_9HYPO|nr:hypothetical protein B0I35DRAFT_405813 [Stachybotrys elegans]